MLDPVKYCAYYLGFGLDFLQTQNSLRSENLDDFNDLSMSIPELITNRFILHFARDMCEILKLHLMNVIPFGLIICMVGNTIDLKTVM
jgi:hypothetical protein